MSDVCAKGNSVHHELDIVDQTIRVVYRVLQWNDYENRVAVFRTL